MKMEFRLRHDDPQQLMMGRSPMSSLADQLDTKIMLGDGESSLLERNTSGSSRRIRYAEDKDASTSKSASIPVPIPQQNSFLRQSIRSSAHTIYSPESNPSLSPASSTTRSQQRPIFRRCLFGGTTLQSDSDGNEQEVDEQNQDSCFSPPSLRASSEMTASSLASPSTPSMSSDNESVPSSFSNASNFGPVSSISSLDEASPSSPMFIAKKKAPSELRLPSHALRRTKSDYGMATISSTSNRIRKSIDQELELFVSNKRQHLNVPCDESQSIATPAKPVASTEDSSVSPSIASSSDAPSCVPSIKVSLFTSESSNPKENYPPNIPNRLALSAESANSTDSPLIRRHQKQKDKFFASKKSGFSMRASADTVPFLFQQETDLPRSCPPTPSFATSLLPPICPSPSKEKEKLILPSTPLNGLNYITVDTVAEVLGGNYCDKIEEYYIIDCRFEYEFEGGHIKNAININSIGDLDGMFFQSPKDGKIALLFHCEFSSQRGPNMCRYLRKKDREIHLDTYPKLYYPEVYVIEGGYKKFYEAYPQLCEPIEYVTMLDVRFEKERKVNMNLSRVQGNRTKVKRSWSTGCIFRPVNADTSASSFHAVSSVPMEVTPSVPDRSSGSAVQTNRPISRSLLAPETPFFPILKSISSPLPPAQLQKRSPLRVEDLQFKSLLVDAPANECGMDCTNVTQ
eukprot:TRINITY_DN6074_c0_g1_i1.p2 TRINITY_DN6074_c0_g1~~TRINITY_DN6074_c0_g1_i1.p2  ORF type:complete len:686 (-),score=142.23 TRINITY_DN6074_c0_g1_i1:49-2106(-)